jgi:hypothetical protein
MPPALPGIDERVNYVGTFNDVEILPAAATLEMLVRSLVSFSDCGRVMQDIVLGVLCGATMGLFVAMIGDFF